MSGSIRRFTLYRLADGEIVGNFDADDDTVALNTPTGHATIEGAFGAGDGYVEGGALVPYSGLQLQAKRERPVHDATWSNAAMAWQDLRPTEQAAQEDAQRARAERDRRLVACDWVTLRAVEAEEPLPEAWATYRQALRDVPGQAGFPNVIDWPAAPAA